MSTASWILRLYSPFRPAPIDPSISVTLISYTAIKTAIRTALAWSRFSSFPKFSPTCKCFMVHKSIQFSPDGPSWSVCINSLFVNVGSVSRGIKCVNAAIICDGSSSSGSSSIATVSPWFTSSTSQNVASQSASACTPGQVSCTADSDSWSCDPTALICLRDLSH